MVAAVAVLVRILSIVSIKCCKSILSIMKKSSLSLLIPRQLMILFSFGVGSTGASIPEKRILFLSFVLSILFYSILAYLL